MYSSYSAAAFALRAAKPAYNYNAHSPYAPSHHCSQQHYDGDGAHRELLPLNPHLSPRFLLDGYLLRHSTHLLLLSARLRPPLPTPPPPHSCCHRRAAARCCCSGGGGGVRSYVQHVTWGLEGRGHRCCGQGAGRSDLGVGCRRLKARGCGCGSYGSGRLRLGTGCGHRDTPRLLGRAVRQEVWEYEGGQWPHRSCSMECHSDWDDEEDEDECGHAQWELPGKASFRRKWKEEEDDICRDCRERKGVENEYYGEAEYSGRRRENRDVNGAHDRHRYHRRRLEQRGYIDGDDTRRRSDVMEGRDRREFESDEARNVGARRYSEDDRKHDQRRERRDSEYEDVLDARRVGAGRYNEDDRRFDRRTGRMDFEIDSGDDVRRDGRRLRNDDARFVIRNTRRKEYMEEDDQDMAERKHYSRGRSASAFHEDDSQRASSSRNTVDTRVARGNSSSRVRWDDNVDRRAAQTLEDREGRYSSLVGLSNDEKAEYNYDDARIFRVRDSRTGTQDVKVITEDDTRLSSGSKNSSIMKHHSDIDRKVAARKDETKKSSLKVAESLSEFRGNNTELDSATRINQLEDRRNYIDNKSSSLQSSVKMASDSRRQIDQHDVVDQQVVALTDSRTSTEKLTDIKMDSSQHVSRASHSQRNYDEVNQMDIDDRSTSVENITHITRDKRRYINQQVIHETDVDVQNVTHVDVSTIHASDISASRSSQNHSETRSDVNSISNISLIDRARGQQEQIHQNKVIACDNTIVRGSQSHHDTGVYGQVHSASVIDSTKEMQEQAELTKAHTSNAATTSTSESHIQTRIYDRFQPSSSVNTVSSVKEQIDLTKIHSSDTAGVSNSHNRSNNEACRTSVLNIVEARDSRDESELQITQGSGIDRSNQVGATFSESSQDSRERLTRVEETGRLVQHNTVLNSQHTGTSRISDDKDITSLGIESTEEASTINVDMEQRGTILGRSETTARENIQGGSSARKSVNESVLASASRLEKSSTFHVGQFVSELQRGVSDAGTTTKKTEKSIMEGTTRSSSRSRMKGPSDEIWDVQSTTSQETFKTADKEEGSSADGGTNSASQTPKSETAIAKNVHKSLWAYVADIVRLGWVKHGESHDSTSKSFKKSSSSNSQRSEGWLSSQGHDNDGIQKRNWGSKQNDHSLMKSHSGESESIVASTLKDESLPTGTQGLQISGAGNVPEVGRSKGEFVPKITKDDVQISGERAKQSEVGASPKGNTMGSSAEDSISTSVDVTVGHSPEHEAGSSSGISTQGSAEIKSGKGVSAGTSCTSIKAKEAGRSEDAGSWRYGPSVDITPYQFPQTQAMVPHENTSSAFLESTELPTGGSTGMKEKIVEHKAPEVLRTEEKDAELKRRKIQRNKQVLKETFDEWEEAYQHDAKQRKTDELFMKEALLEAQRAADIWEVPVGAVLVHNGEIIARGCNLVEDLRDSTAHAEIVCIREASSKLKTWRLADTTLYVTLEPCAMCAGAILQARVDTVVWGAPNKLLGADGSWVRLFPGDGQTSTLDPANQKQAAGPVHPFHPKIIVRRGVLSIECSEIMQQFFQLRRKKKRAESPPRAHYSGHRHHPIKFFTKMQHMFGTVFCL
uniref:tRNA(adenine(34)) deaminase n=2 Tax=Hordeum vulgare subsp. vulgare TaxID=112509 RepID=A0A8I6Z9F3_HORVV